MQRGTGHPNEENHTLSIFNLARVQAMREATKNDIDHQTAVTLSRLFSPSIYRELARFGRSKMFTRLLHESGLIHEANDSDCCIQDIFEKAFTKTSKTGYRSEYIYKSAITQKILLGAHNLNTATLLTEFRAGKSKADMVVINGTTVIYEIKSEKDKLDRLPQQVADYSKVSPKINVITTEKYASHVANLVPNHVGIMKLTDRYQISTVRSPLYTTAFIDSDVLFHSLSLQESSKVLKALGVDIPKIPNTQLYKELRSRFLELPTVDLHESTVQVLKESRNASHLKEFVDELPPSLSATALVTRINRTEMSRLLSVMKLPANNVLNWI